MTGNHLNDPMMDIMYQNALHSLYAGAIMPHEQEILAMAPLPGDVVDTFASQEIDPKQIMRVAYGSLVTWIDEAKKASYFSKRFTDLSKLVMKGVMTMGRGLITLHNRGEDLAQAPMDISDLISVSSYHFRKSCLGVVQTAKSHPEISERLLMNELSWTNMLLRLYKTKDKLEGDKKSEIINKISSPDEEGITLLNEEGRMKNERLTGRNAAASSFRPLDAALSEVSAIFEPAALGAPRAFSALDKGQRSQRPAVSHQQSVLNRQQPALSGEVRSDGEDQAAVIGGETTVSSRRPAVRDEMMAEGGHETPESERVADENGEVMEAEEHETPEIEGMADGNSEGTEDKDPEPRVSDLPQYLKILRTAFGRSGPSENGKLKFTADELKFLVSDPLFNQIYPKSAADIRSILLQTGTG